MLLRSHQPEPDLGDRVRDAGEEAAEQVRTALGTLAEALGSLLRMLLRLVSLVPGVASALFGGLSRVLYRLGDRSAELSGTRRPGSRRHAALWFAGGFAAGTATGYAVAEAWRAKERGEHAPPRAMPGMSSQDEDAAPTAR